MQNTSERPVRYAAGRLGLRLLFALAFILFVTQLVPQLWNVLSPFIIALPVAAMLQPLIRFFQKKLHFRRGLAVGFWVLVVCTVAFVLIYWFVSFAVGQVVSAANNAQSIISSITGVLKTASDRILGLADNMSVSVSDAIRDSLNSAFKWLGDQATDIAGQAVNYLVSIATGLPYAFIYANFLVLAIFFVSSRYDSISSFFHRRDAEMQNGENMSMLRKSAGKGAIGYIRVQMLFFFVILVVSWVYFQIQGYQYAILIATLAALLELIPQFGCGTLYIPWALICFIIGDTHTGWMVLGLYMVYCLLRRLLEPGILGSNLGMSPLLSLIGMFVGMRLGGVVGLILGPICMVILVSALRSHIFDGLIGDFRTVLVYSREWWKRGRKVDA